IHKSGSPKEIKAELDNVHSTSAPVFATVYNWVNEFKRGEIIDKVHDIVLTDRRVKVRVLVEATSISHGTVISILHEQLGMKKLSTRWVPRFAHFYTCPAPMAKFNEFRYKLLRKEIYHQRAAHHRNRVLRNKNESIKKNVFYYVFLKTY
ncbi:hypothetical protein ALC56_01389, partial [Trachymyrmex septentrionalis]